jgi:hypothetical protein
VPYSDPSEQAEFSRKFYLRKYQSDPEFREAEALRKKKWYDQNRNKILARYRKRRKKKIASAKFLQSEAAILAADLKLHIDFQNVLRLSEHSSTVQAEMAGSGRRSA